MVVIITPLGYAKIYNQCVRCVLVITGIITHYNNNNKELYAQHERDKISQLMNNAKARGILQV
jgi:hypothetical protein